ncbi:MAG: hypothetical protein JST21_07090 [Bacteroidetes bacterium]|nr:hypothetical protein [Bacteroidota bacterium]
MKGTHHNAIFENVLLQSKLETQECSVLNLNRELYDNIGQLLSSTKLLLAMVTMELKQVPDALITAEHTIGKAIKDLRLLSKSINDEWSHQFDLKEQIQRFIEKTNVVGKTKTQLTCDFDNLPLEHTIQIILSRVFFETIAYINKNVCPNNISIEISDLPDIVEFKIEHDNNKTVTLKKQNQFFQQIHQRLKLLGGTMKRVQLPQCKTIKFSVPKEE